MSKSDNVVIVNSSAIVDALSATPFAKMKNAPILLTGAENLNNETKKEITRLGAKNVYVIGDCAYNEENGNCTNPQIVEAAEQTAATAAKNIIASNDNKEKSKFKGNYHGFMVSIGGRYGVANLSGIKLSGFFAMVMKHIVNMYYLFGVLNVYSVYHYLQHEFF